MTPTNELFFDGVVSLLDRSRTEADWTTYGDLLEDLDQASIGIIPSDEGHILVFPTGHPALAR